MPPLRSLVVVLLLAASLAHSLPQDDPSRNLDFTFADKTRVLASRVSGRDLTRPRRQSSSSRLVDYQGGSGKLEYKDERDMDEPGTDSGDLGWSSLGPTRSLGEYVPLFDWGHHRGRLR